MQYLPGVLQAVLLALATCPAAHGVHTATLVLPPGLVLLPAHSVQVLPTRLVPAGQVPGAVNFLRHGWMLKGLLAWLRLRCVLKPCHQLKCK